MHGSLIVDLVPNVIDLTVSDDDISCTKSSKAELAPLISRSLSPTASNPRSPLSTLSYTGSDSQNMQLTIPDIPTSVF